MMQLMIFEEGSWICQCSAAALCWTEKGQQVMRTASSFCSTWDTSQGWKPPFISLRKMKLQNEQHYPPAEHKIQPKPNFLC